MQQKLLTVIISTLLITQTLAKDDLTLDPVVVESAYAIPAEHDNTGSSVTLLTQNDFKKRQATYVIDVLKTVPGLAIGSTGGHGAQSSVFIRGANSNHVLVVIDGVKVNPASGNGFNFGTLPLNQIERIEILRGEQSALWGSSAVGGVINIITQSGKYATQPFNADLHLGMGSHHTTDASATLSGRQGGLYYAINANHNRSDNISALSTKKFTYTSQTGQTITTGGAVENDEFKHRGLSLQLGYEFENAGLEARYTYNKSTTHFDESSLATETNSDPQTEIEQDIFHLTGYLGQADDVIRQTANFSIVNTDSETTHNQFPSDSKEKSVHLGYQFDHYFDRQGETTQSISYLFDWQKDTFNSKAFNEEKAIKTKSFTAEYRLFNDNDHALSIGIRHDDHSKTQSATTYKIAGGYRLNDHFRLHASLGTGIKLPSIFDYYGWNGQYIGNANLQPEKSRGGDIGLLIESSDKAHQLDITYFNRHVDNFIASQSTGTWPNLVTQSINLAGKTQIHGIELAYRGQITDSLSAYANYTHTKSEDSKGKPLARRPAHQGNLGLNYQVNESLGTSASLSYQGSRVNSYFNPLTYQASKVDMPSYTVINVGADYQFSKNLSAYLNINNIFDKSYENVIGYGQPGRTVYLGIKGSW